MSSAARIEQDWDHIAFLAADLHDAHARLVDFVSTVLAEGSWQAAGLRSPEHWLMLRVGLSRGQAASIVLMASRAGELPATTTALRAGRISLDQAAVVARHTPAAFDETVAEFAQHATVTQLQRSVTRYDFAPTDPTDPDDVTTGEGEPGPGETAPGPQDEQAQEKAAAAPVRQREPVQPARLSMGYDDEGRFRLRYDAPAEIGALIEVALKEAKDHLFRTLTRIGTHDEVLDRQALDGDVLDPDHDETDGGRPRVTWADALALMATRSLDATTPCTTPHPSTDPGSPCSPVGAPPSPGPLAPPAPPTRWAGWARWARYRVQVHLDTDGAWLTGRPRLPQHVVDKLTCEGTLTPVWESEGQPVNVGRSLRIVPDRIRDLVLDRDRGCRFPGCASTHHLEIHHLVHWRDGGPTDLVNLAALCTFHHDGHHRGEFTITGDPTHPDGLTFETRYGLLIGPPARPARPARPPAQPARPARPARPAARLGRRYPAPSGAPLHLHLVDFTPITHPPPARS